MSPRKSPCDLAGTPARDAALDRGYVSAKLRATFAADGCTAHAPPKLGMVDPPPWDRAIYARRHHVENLFSKLKDWGRIALRRDKTRQSWMGLAHLAATLINLRVAEFSHRPYSIAWIGLAWSVKRVPFWQPRVVRPGDAAFVPDQRPAGCMMLLFLVMGAAIGVTLPMAISDVLPRDPTRFYGGGASDLDGFGRLAMLVGGLCGGYVGLRGSRLWAVLLVVGGALRVASAILAWMFHGL